MIFQAILISLLYVFNVFATKEFYDLKATDIYGMDVDFQKFKGKVLLIVNVASQCGFTDSHYRDLQKMQDILGNDDHFLVLGFPCNQFGQQEPDDNAAIDEFVKTNYNVDFPMFSKIDVRGESISPVWQYLTDESKVTPEWNFYKYLVNHEGKILNVYPPRVSVDHAFDEVHKAVKKARRASKQKPKTVKKELHNEL